jgi:hypothetical protein
MDILDRLRCGIVANEVDKLTFGICFISLDTSHVLRFQLHLAIALYNCLTTPVHLPATYFSTAEYRTLNPNRRSLAKSLSTGPILLTFYSQESQ